MRPSALRMAWVCAALAACSTRREPGRDLAPSVELRRPSDLQRLSLAIGGVHTQQRRLAAWPWHEPGGDWTFVDATADSAQVVIGWVEGESRGDGMRFGPALLGVENTAAAEAFLQALARSFGDALPAPRAGAARRVLDFEMIRFAADVGKHPDGFHGPGTWTAGKWSLVDDGRAAEVFFNYDLTGHRAELVEKAPIDRDKLYTILAGALRDGPRPPRTFGDGGLRFGPWRPLGDGNVRMRAATDDGQVLFLGVPDRHGETLFAVPADHPELKRRIGHFDGAAMHVSCAAGGNDPCLVSIQHQTRVKRDSVSVWNAIWSNDHRKQRRILDECVDDGALLDNHALSPDARYAALYDSRASNVSTSGRREVLCVVPLSGGASIAIDLPHRTLGLVRWRGQELVVSARPERSYDDASKEIYLADPATGALTAAPDEKLRLLAGTASPDGRRFAREVAGTLTLRDSPTGPARTLRFDPDDLQAPYFHCCEWLGSRYLTFTGQRQGLVDVTTLQIIWPDPDIEMLPDAKHALRGGDTRPLEIADILQPLH